MSFFGSTTSTSATLGGTNANEPKDVEVSDPPNDSISSVSFSSAGEYLAVGSWNNEVRTLREFEAMISWKWTD